MSTTTRPIVNITDDNCYFFNCYFDSTAVIGCGITFIILACILNGVVIVNVLCQYVKQPAVRTGSPELLVMLPSCVLMVYDALGSAVMVYMRLIIVEEGERNFETVQQRMESDFSCEGFLVSELTFAMFQPIVNLLVGTVIVLEGLRLQRFVTLRSQNHMVVAVVLLVSSTLYGFVVIIPVFYFRFLSDDSEPCRKDSIYLNIDPDNYRSLYVAEFIVPHCLVFVACLLLLIAFFTRGSGSRPGVCVHSVSAPVSHTVSGGSADTNHAVNMGTSEQSGPSVHTDNDLAGIPGHSHGNNSQRDRFPWYALAAGVVSFTFGFVFFFNAYTYMRIPFNKRAKLWAAGRLLFILKAVFVPCCWLLGRHVRTMWNCCRGPLTCGLTGGSPQGGGGDQQPGQTVSTTQL